MQAWDALHTVPSHRAPMFRSRDENKAEVRQLAWQPVSNVWQAKENPGTWGMPGLETALLRVESQFPHSA